MDNEHISISGASTFLSESELKKTQELLERTKKEKNKSTRNFLIVIASMICLTVFIRLLFPITLVSGQSMSPTYHDHQMLSATSTWIRDIKKGDVAILKNQDTKESHFIKRVVGVPGDTLQIINGILYINDEPEDRDLGYIDFAGCLEDPLTLGKNKYFLMGDNRKDNMSYDCRYFGAVDKSDIKYIVNFTLF